MVRTIFIFFSVFILSSYSIKAQDPEFSQFFNNPLYLNPAFAGVNYGPRICAAYRNEWPALGNAFISYTASYDQYVESLHSGFGILGASDQQASGLLSTNSLTGMYALQLDANKKFAIRLALQGSVLQTGIKNGLLIFGENISADDGSVSGTSSDVPDLSSRVVVDFGGGVLFYSTKFFGGASVKHITQPDVSLYSSGSSPLNMRLAGNAGFEISSKPSSNSQMFISPNVMYVQQGKFIQITGGASFGASVLYGGFYYRYTFENADAIIPMAGVKAGIFKLGYSYDYTVSPLAGKTGGSHEVTVIINFHDSKSVARKQQRGRFTQCPNIF